MAVEKRIYSGWAFTPDELGKRDMNYLIYSELKDNAFCQYPSKPADEDTLKTKFVYEHAGSGYAHTKYRTISNPNQLSQLEMALICDSGNLCFGHRIQDGLIVIHTD